jgi:hypothetical protein
MENQKTSQIVEKIGMTSPHLRAKIGRTRMEEWLG